MHQVIYCGIDHSHNMISKLYQPDVSMNILHPFDFETYMRYVSCCPCMMKAPRSALSRGYHVDIKSLLSSMKSIVDWSLNDTVAHEVTCPSCRDLLMTSSCQVHYRHCLSIGLDIAERSSIKQSLVNVYVTNA